MRNLRQLNNWYNPLGYSLARQKNNTINVYFEGEHIWTIHRQAKIADVIETMSDMPWLAWEVNSCDNNNAVITLPEGWSLTESTRGLWVNFDGDCHLGNISHPYRQQSSYLTEAEYEATKHLMEF